MPPPRFQLGARAAELLADEPAVQSSIVPRADLLKALAGAAETSRAAAWGAVAGPEEDESEPTIQVTIGRIEVKAPPQPPPPPARATRQGPRITLTEYMRRRREGR